jgi:hypothetical protein
MNMDVLEIPTNLKKTDSEKLGQITNPTQGIGNKYTPRAE